MGSYKVLSSWKVMKAGDDMAKKEQTRGTDFFTKGNRSRRAEQLRVKYMENMNIKSITLA